MIDIADSGFKFRLYLAQWHTYRKGGSASYSSPSESSSSSSSSDSSPSPIWWVGIFNIARACRSDDSRNGKGGTLERCPNSCPRPGFSWSFNNKLASARIFEAKQSNKSCGFHTWPLGRTFWPLRLVLQAGWFSTKETGFISLGSCAPCRIVCCTELDLWVTNIS